MATLGEIREAIKETLEENIPGIKCYRYIPENALVLPAIIVEPEMASFVEAMGRGTDRWDFTLLVLVGFNHLESAHDDLVPFVSVHGNKSIREVISENKTLCLDDANPTDEHVYDYGMPTAQDIPECFIEGEGARRRLTVYAARF